MKCNVQNVHNIKWLENKLKAASPIFVSLLISAMYVNLCVYICLRILS